MMRELKTKYKNQWNSKFRYQDSIALIYLQICIETASLKSDSDWNSDIV